MNSGQYLTFKLKNSPYAVGIEHVREINRMTDISTVPESPDFIAGVMNLRGKVITVLDLRKRLSIEVSDVTKETCIVVLDSEIGSVGVIVDSVQAVIHLTGEQIDACPATNHEQAFIRGVGKTDDELIMLIDVRSCLSKQDILGLRLAA